MLRNVRGFAVMTILLGALAGCQALTGQTLGQNIDDTTLTTTVKTQLAKDKLATLTRIGVDTYNGVVSLSGVVTSPGAKARAEEIAKSVNGVKEVNNNLQVQKN
ncbi:MAG: BON domain-containing protein [Candidatus Binatia bacterium]